MINVIRKICGLKKEIGSKFPVSTKSTPEEARGTHRPKREYTNNDEENSLDDVNDINRNRLDHKIIHRLLVLDRDT